MPSLRSPQVWSSPAAMALNVAGGDWVVPGNGEGWVEITEIGVLASQRHSAAGGSAVGSLGPRWAGRGLAQPATVGSSRASQIVMAIPNIVNTMVRVCRARSYLISPRSSVISPRT